MRYQGIITKWKDEEGYGFVTPRGGGKEVFLHVKSFGVTVVRPVGDEVVTYEVSLDEQGRKRATNVRYLGENEPGIGRNVPAIQWAVVAIFGALFALSSVSRLSFIVPFAVLVMSLVTYAVYNYDKARAQANHWRVPESTLHLLALMGGWPGAFLAQHQLRHKLRKPGFMSIFWLTVVVNCIAIATLCTPLSEPILRFVEFSNKR